ncbi:Protein of unknown function DUF1592 [Chthoniobacter flavus Ellin428]|uniref:Cytochrome c domain-containing protein n=1 Tax=Chthoniobacter flavus Ellin428 TaxID=497964 RepID=B4DC21_9BACT|nr:Protein of unknown function DUF1592 [Chthoniobacter flavus Ellin428]TCO85252.1 cytochrome c [Chthoniobacter flavus]
MPRKGFYIGIPFVVLAFVAGWFLRHRQHQPAAPERHIHVGGAIGAAVPEATRQFISARCIDCHDGDTHKGGLNFEALTAQLDDAPTEAKWIRVFDRVQRGEMPPKKEPRPPDSERAVFMESLGGFLTQHDAARHAGTGRVVWRRLNRGEYENTVHDLLAIDTPLADLLPEDGSAHGFDNVSEGLRLSASEIEAYLTAADTALNDAINLQPRPVAIKEHVEFLELPRVKEVLATPHGTSRPNGSKTIQFFRALPDALVMFINQANKTMPFSSRASATGLYRVRLSAFAFQNQGGPTVTAKLVASDLNEYRLVAAFDLPTGQPRVAETTIRLNKSELLILTAAGCGVATDGTEIATVGGEHFTGSGLAAQWAEMEGPLLETWPPVSVQRVFGDLPVTPRTDGGYAVMAGNAVAKVDELVARFAQRAFRRPASAEDLASYSRLAHEVLEKGGSLEKALRRSYKAILASPEFLFLRETPGKLDDYALASRLSYFFWSSMPDEELLRLAAQGVLHEPATLQAQTERLLNSPKAQAFTKNFCGQWLSLRAINATTPDKLLYPEFDDLLQAAMVNETEHFFTEMVRGDLTVATFIDSDFAMLNRRLAEHYGIAGVAGEEFRKVSLPAGSHRGGVLTQASILKVTANGTLSSPVLRGAWVMEHLLGRRPQPPPADAGTIEPDTRGSTTIREQLAKHRRSETCAGCHKYMDPFGFALESYDVIGGWREEYRKRKGKAVLDPFTHHKLKYGLGLPVDSSGELADGRTFGNIEQLKRLLLDQQEIVARAFANNLVAYATGAAVTFSDRPQVEEILAQSQSRSYPVRSMIYAIVQSPLFQTK